MIKLDKYIQVKKEEQFEIEGVVYTANYSARNMLTATELNKNEKSDKQQLLNMMDVFFGKENAKVIVDKLSTKGIMSIIETITEDIGAQQDDEKKLEPAAK